MSLINDALKQTKQIRPPNPSSGPPPLSPVKSPSQGNGSWLVPVVIILLFAAAGIFIGLLLSGHAPPASTPLIAAATNQQVETVAAAPAIATNIPPDSNTVVMPPKPLAPKLQGILFAATRPCAIVSGKTVFVGDHVGQFRVAAILQDSITLQNKTETNVLSLNPK